MEKLELVKNAVMRFFVLVPVAFAFFGLSVAIGVANENYVQPFAEAAGWVGVLIWSCLFLRSFLAMISMPGKSEEKEAFVHRSVRGLWETLFLCVIIVLTVLGSLDPKSHFVWFVPWSGVGAWGVLFLFAVGKAYWWRRKWTLTTNS